MHGLERNDGSNPLFHLFLSCELEICCTIFTQQVCAWSRSCVDRVVICLLALKSADDEESAAVAMTDE